jgi:hypothetical protein
MPRPLGHRPTESTNENIDIQNFSPSSVQFKGEINDAVPRKRHQKRHLEFCTAYLLSAASGSDNSIQFS